MRACAGAERPAVRARVATRSHILHNEIKTLDLIRGLQFSLHGTTLLTTYLPNVLNFVNKKLVKEVKLTLKL